MKPRYRTTVLFALMAMTLSGAVARAVSMATAEPSGSSGSAARIERGAYLVRTMGCHDCHTPWKMGPKGPEQDMSRALTGHPQDVVMPPPPALPPGPWNWMGAATNTAFAGPWGVSFTANLTPDIETGLGRWSEADFIRTIRTGRHMGRGRAVLPPMPIAVYNHFTDRDLKAIYAYLRTIPPIRNKVPDPAPPAPQAAR
jgi:mono/diheme cytochrome c family protein